MAVSRPSQYIIHRCLDLYLAGKIEWASLHITIIKALVEQNDTMFDERLRAASLAMPPHFLQK
jgi:hypothetical protein